MGTPSLARLVLPAALLFAASCNSVSLPAQGTQSLMQPPTGRFWLDRGSLTMSCQVDLQASDRVEVTTGTFDCGGVTGAAEAVALPWGISLSLGDFSIQPDILVSLSERIDHDTFAGESLLGRHHLPGALIVLHRR